MVAINATIRDEINRICHYRDNLEHGFENDTKTITMSLYDVNKLSKSELIALLNEHESFEFDVDELSLCRKLNANEVNERIDENTHALNYCIDQLKSRMTQRDGYYKNQILAYLEAHSIKIDGIN